MVGERKTESVGKVITALSREFKANPDLWDRIDEKPGRSWTENIAWDERERKKSRATQIILKKEEKRKERIRRMGQRYEMAPVHLFPEHPEAPYRSKRGIFSGHSLNAAYTAQYLRDYRAGQNGELKSLPKEKQRYFLESISERTYIALMARARIEQRADLQIRDNAIKVFEDIVMPDILERYSHLDKWTERNVREAYLPRCVDVMEEGFSARINGIDMMLFQIFKNIVLKNGKRPV
jgi:hypothetical protein